MVKLPKEEKANEVVYLTQKLFSEFSNATVDTTKMSLAQRCLSGDGANSGALKIMSKYGGTQAANLAAYYAGACYLHLKQFDKSIKYLKDFETSATQIQSRAYGMIGDAYSELKKKMRLWIFIKRLPALMKRMNLPPQNFCSELPYMRKLMVKQRMR